MQVHTVAHQRLDAVHVGPVNRVKGHPHPVEVGWHSGRFASGDLDPPAVPREPGGRSTAYRPGPTERHRAPHPTTLRQPACGPEPDVASLDRSRLQELIRFVLRAT
jgi:hypothetical protein